MSLLEERVPLSESVLWTIQKRFYEQKGISAWGQKIVPCYITTNPWVAAQYAKVVVGYIQDMLCKSTLNPDADIPNFDINEPFYIIEYGAGSGRLGFYFLKAIQRMRQTMHFLRKVKLVYVMTDFTMSNINYWMNHEKLQPFYADGMLDCAVVDAQHPYEDIHLLRSGVHLGPSTITNPLVAIGNYFFCVVAADAFLVDKHGNLSESLLTTRSPVPNDSIDDVTIIERVRKTFTQVPVNATTRYPAPDHPALNRVLQEYQETLSSKGVATSFLLPCGVTRSIEGLVRLCNNHDHVLVFCGDKGYNSLSEFEGRVGYPMSVEGSFSFMANMDAMGRYFIARGGSVLMNPTKVEAQGDTCLAVACYSTHGNLRDMPNTYHAFEASLGEFGPADFYQVVHVMTVCENGQLPPDAPPPVDVNPENRYLDPNGDLSEFSPSAEGNPAEEASSSVGAAVAAGGTTAAEPTAEQKLRYQSCIREAGTCGYSLQQMLAVMRMSHFDPYVFWQVRARMLLLTSIVVEEEKLELKHIIQQTMDNYFHINEEDDLPFELGRLAYQLQLDNYEYAIELYTESVRLFGSHYITHYNLALCYNETGKQDHALEHLECAITMNPEYQAAVSARAEILAKRNKAPVAIDVRVN